MLLKEYKEEEAAPEADAGKETLYVMRVAVSKDEDGEEIEDFEPIDEELAERLIPVIRTRWQTPDINE